MCWKTILLSCQLLALLIVVIRVGENTRFDGGETKGVGETVTSNYEKSMKEVTQSRHPGKARSAPRVPSIELTRQTPCVPSINLPNLPLQTAKRTWTTFQRTGVDRYVL